MKTSSTFFSHLLGEYWGTPVQLGPSSRTDYTICVYSGDDPDPERFSVLHLNLNKRTGMHDLGMHWRIYGAGGERTGHAWDDNMPDPAPTVCEFEEWVEERIADMILQLTRRQLQAAMHTLQDDAPRTKNEWIALQACLRELEEQFSRRPSWPNHDPKEFEAGFLDNAEEEGCSVTLGLARCALALGQKREADRLIQRFKKVGWLRSKLFHQMMAEGRDHYVVSGLTCSAMVKESFQSLVAPLIGLSEGFWCEVMMGPMKQLASYDSERGGLDSQLRFHRWLVSLDRPRLMRQWLELLVAASKTPEELIQFARCLHTESLASMGVELMDRAMAQGSLDHDGLAQLSALLRCSQQDDRADQVDAQITARGFADGVDGLIEEYLLLFNRVASIQRATGSVPLRELDSIVRLREVESQLNAYWLGHPAGLHEQLCRQGRFVCGGSTLWVTMCRDHEDYGPILETMDAIFSDWSFVKLLHDSNRASLYALITNGCGGLLDSADPRALPLAERVVRGALERLSDKPHAYVSYQYACVLARAGDAALALGLITHCLDYGEPKESFRRDSDFAALRDDPRFRELVTEGA